MQNKINILLVDDDIDDRELISTILSRSLNDIVITEAKDLGETLNALEQDTMDIILLDYNLAGITGLDILAEIRSRNTTIPIIMLTGVASENVIIESLQQGVNDYVLKSIPAMKLLSGQILTLLDSGINKISVEDSYYQDSDSITEQIRKYTFLFEKSPLAMLICDKLGTFQWGNKTSTTLTGYTATNLLGKHILAMAHSDDSGLFNTNLSMLFSGQTDYGSFEARLRRYDDSIIWCDIDASLVRDLSGKPDYTIIQIKDISSRKTAEMATSKQHRMTQLLSHIAIISNTSNSIDEALPACLNQLCNYLEWPIGHVYKRASDGTFESSGIWYVRGSNQYMAFQKYSESKRLQANDYRKPRWLLKDCEEPDLKHHYESTNCNFNSGIIFPVMLENQLELLIEFYTEEDLPEDREVLELFTHVCSQLGRIIERCKSQSILRQSNRSLDILHKCDHSVAHVKTAEGLVEDICRILVDKGDFIFTWAGFITENETKPIYEVSHSGKEISYLDNLLNQQQNNSRELKVINNVIKSSQPVVVNDIEMQLPIDPAFAETLQMGFHSVVVLPLKTGGQVFGIMAIYSDHTDSFNHNEMKLLNSVVDSLAFGIMTVHVRNESHHAEKLVRSSEQKYRLLFDEHPSIFFIIDKDSTITSINKFGAKSLGYDRDELTGSFVIDIHTENCKADAKEFIQSSFNSTDEVHRHELRLLHKDKSVIHVRMTARTVKSDDGNVNLFIVCEDITQVRLLSDQLAHQVTHDSLTGLINRIEFEFRLNRLIEKSTPEGIHHALCYVDLDNFKLINDSYGHACGDELLTRIGNLFRHEMRSRDTIARLGSDEFAILMERCDLENAEQKCRRLMQKISTLNFDWEGRQISVGTSMGLIPISKKTVDVVSILKWADAACYAAKDNGGNQLFVYHEDSASDSERFGQVKWISQISEALEQDGLQLYFQPIIPLQNKQEKELHYELLLRIESADGNIIPANRFLPIAERFGLADKLDRWVIERAISTLHDMSAHLRDRILLSINLSGQSLSNLAFLDFLRQKFTQRENAVNRLCIEITETAAITNLTKVVNLIQELKKYGCRFSLDDFGTGLSSFAYLRNLDVDYLKIDKFFVNDLGNKQNDITILKSMNDVGKSLGKKTIAEGVETAAQLRILRELGVDYAQGFAVGKPAPFNELQEVDDSNIIQLIS
jgi:diguanylate cyclase (GGDEF)-like protein/PAS domain S-box-containing protein